MMKIKYEQIEQVLTIVFLIVAGLCSVSILVAFLITLSPHISITDWDFLAFLGSIIGGVITWWGVKKTLTEQRKERFLNDYRAEMRELHGIVKDTRYIINVRIFELSTDGEDGQTDRLGTLHLHADYINDFIEVMTSKMPDLISTVEWDVVHSLDIKLKILSGFKVFYNRLDFYINRDGINKIQSVVDEYLDKAVELHTFLDQHREKIMKKYYEINTK